MGRLSRHRKIRADDVFNPKRRAAGAQPEHVKKKMAERDLPITQRDKQERFKGLKQRFHSMLKEGKADKGRGKGGRKPGAASHQRSPSSVMANRKAVPEPRKRKHQPEAASASSAPSASSADGKAEAGADGGSKGGAEGEGEEAGAGAGAGTGRDMSKLRFKTKRMPNESFQAFSRRIDEEARSIVQRETKRPKVVSDRRKRYLKLREERERAKKRRRKNGGLSDGDEDDAPEYEHVEFGEVVERPPEIKVRPKTKRAPNAVLLAAAAAAAANGEDSEDDNDRRPSSRGKGGKGGNRSKGGKEHAARADAAGSDGGGEAEVPTEAELNDARNARMRERQVDLMRQRAILSYKNAKKARRSANPRRGNDL